MHLDRDGLPRPFDVLHGVLCRRRAFRITCEPEPNAPPMTREGTDLRVFKADPFAEPQDPAIIHDLDRVWGTLFAPNLVFDMINLELVDLRFIPDNKVEG